MICPRPSPTVSSMRASTPRSAIGLMEQARATSQGNGLLSSPRITTKSVTGDGRSPDESSPARRTKTGGCACDLVSIYPFLFMGEECGELAPLQYFTSFSAEALAAAVRKGRREEFARFEWTADVPDPQDPVVLERSKLCDKLRGGTPHAQLPAFYRELIRLRKAHLSLGFAEKEHQVVHTLADDETICLYRGIEGGEESCVVFHLGAAHRKATIPLPEGRWPILLDSAAKECGGQAACTIKGEFLESAGALEVSVGPYHVLGFLLDIVSRRLPQRG